VKTRGKRQAEKNGEKQRKKNGEGGGREFLFDYSREGTGSVEEEKASPAQIKWIKIPIVSQQEAGLSTGRGHGGRTTTLKSSRFAEGIYWGKTITRNNPVVHKRSENAMIQTTKIRGPEPTVPRRGGDHYLTTRGGKKEGDQTADVAPTMRTKQRGKRSEGRTRK